MKTGVFDAAINRIDKAAINAPAQADFEFEPVPLQVFLKEKKYLGLPLLSERQEEAVEYATHIYFPETIKELGWKRRRYVREVVLLWGKGSGKDFISRIILLRCAYLILALKNPQEYYYGEGHQCGIERIDMLNTASSKVQAWNNFFDPLRKYVMKSPFFKNRANVLTTEIRFDKAINLLSGHSEAEAQEGLNLIIVVLDEIAAFKTDEEIEDIRRLKLRKNVPQSAASLHDFATTSIATRFPKVGKVVCLSFPRFKGDFITTRYDEGKDDPLIYASKGATYHINPTKTLKDFDFEKKRNPIRFKCRIQCDPGIAEDAFFKNVVALERSFKHELESPIDPFTNRFKSTFICEDDYVRFAHADLAKNRDRAAFAIVHAYEVHKHEVKDKEDKITVVELPLIKLDVIMYFTAPPGGEIIFEEIQDRILELTEKRGFHIELLTFDGYQSLQMMQTMNAKGITAELQSVDKNREAYETWQDVMYEGRFLSYYNKILVEDEIPYLVDVKGRKIEHRAGKGKDGADAVAGAVNNCVKSESWGGMPVWAGGSDIGGTELEQLPPLPDLPQLPEIGKL